MATKNEGSARKTDQPEPPTNLPQALSRFQNVMQQRSVPQNERAAYT